MWPLDGAGSVIRGGAPPFPHAVAVLPPLPANQNHNHNHHHHHHHHQHYHDHHHHQHQPPTPQGEFATVCLFHLTILHWLIANLIVSAASKRNILYYFEDANSMAHACETICPSVANGIVESSILVGLQRLNIAWAFATWTKIAFLEQKRYVWSLVRDVRATINYRTKLLATNVALAFVSSVT